MKAVNAVFKSVESRAWSNTPFYSGCRAEMTRISAFSVDLSDRIRW